MALERFDRISNGPKWTKMDPHEHEMELELELELEHKLKLECKQTSQLAKLCRPKRSSLRHEFR